MGVCVCSVYHLELKPNITFVLSLVPWEICEKKGKKKQKEGEGRKESEGRGKKGKLQLNMVAHTCNSSIWETEAGSIISSSGPAWITYFKKNVSIFPSVQFHSHLSDLVCSSVVQSHFQTFTHWFFCVYWDYFWLPNPDLRTHRMSRLELFGYQFVRHWNKVTVRSIPKVSCWDESCVEQLQSVWYIVNVQEGKRERNRKDFCACVFNKPGAYHSLLYL